MKLEEEKKQVEKSYLDEMGYDNGPFIYERHKNTYYIPVYPRAFIEEVVNIDYDRRTVTAKFVLMVTVCLNVDNAKVRKFLREHLILEFGYNQILFIPEYITLENSPFLISRLPTHDKDSYVNYRISGAIECSAEFDSMFFPYRRIEITNHLCIRPQEYRELDQKGNCKEQYFIRYNIMMLLEKDHEKYAQFLPYSGSKHFGDFKIDHHSSQAVAETDYVSIQKHFDIPEVIQQFYHMVSNKDIKMMSSSASRKQLKPNYEQIWDADDLNLQPFQHMGLRFTMSSLSIGFTWQQEVPLWMLSIVTLFLYHAQPNIGNKFSNIILLLVSYISILSNFRSNNIVQQNLTCYQGKIMALIIVPILLIITTAIDYYDMDMFTSRSDQIQNPFNIASIAIVGTCLVVSLGFLIYLWITRFLCEDKPKPVKGDDLIDWVKMVELDWGNQKLEERMNEIIDKRGKTAITLHPTRNRQDSRILKDSKKGRMGSKEGERQQREEPGYY